MTFPSERIIFREIRKAQTFAERVEKHCSGIDIENEEQKYYLSSFLMEQLSHRLIALDRDRSLGEASSH